MLIHNMKRLYRPFYTNKFSVTNLVQIIFTFVGFGGFENLYS